MNDQALVKDTVRDMAKRAFDIDAIRKDFPILSREVYGKPLVYLDSAASAQKPQVVIDAMSGVMEEEFANVHRGLHYLSNVATEHFEAARETVRAFINAKETAEVILTGNATDAINLVANSLGVDQIEEGDEIILSVMEHHSNIVPWHFLRERNGAVLKWVPMSDEGELDMEAYEALFSSRTKLVAITHMSNALGTINPAKEITRIAHEHGARVLLDGSQSAVHLDIDVQDLDCDFFVFTGHKTYGPTGVGVLYGKRKHLEAMQPYRGGGEMISIVTQDDISWADLPHKFEAGTPAIVEVIGLKAALDYMTSFDRADIHAHEADLLKYATERLEAMNSIRLFGTAPNKGSIVSFELVGAHAHDVSTIIDRSGVAVRAGHHCAQPLMDRLGVTSTARASFALYNCREDVDSLCTALEKAKDLLG
jgi:cysteine desulfurase/selenocysteine lyase